MISESQRVALAGHRNPKWLATLLDARDVPIRELEFISGDVIIAPYERLGGSAGLELTTDDQSINWLTDRVRISYDPGVAGVEPWDMGVYLFASPKQKTNKIGRVIYSVDLLTKLAILDGMQLTESYVVQSGDNLVESAASLIRSTGEQVLVTESSLVAREPLVFAAGDNLLTVCNNILTAAGYWGVYVSGSGIFTLAPYVDPRDRSPVWQFTNDELSIIKTEMSFEQNLADVPNQVICHTNGTDEEPALVAVASNNDFESPFSIQNRGRVISKTYQVDASDVSVLQATANRYLANNMNPVSRWLVEHAVIPITGNDAVTIFVGDEVKHVTVQKMEMKLKFDSQCKTTLRQGVAVD